MKDFDFQIKKNQEDFTNLNEKVENLSKDLDDLVSLYEIVSEQMNPFVGLSKVTKKRLDALESFTKDLDSVKTRLGELETNIEKGISITGEITAKSPHITPSTQSTPTASPITPKSDTKKALPGTPGRTFQPSIGPQLSETEMDDILSRSLESLLMDTQIESMINEFFLSLK